MELLSYQMAKKIVHKDLTAIVLTRQEAADTIAMLVGLLADRPIYGNELGATPSVIVKDDKGNKFELAITIED